MGLALSDSQTLLFDIAERSKAGVAALAAELQAIYAMRYQHVADVHDEQKLRQLTAAFESQMNELDELHAAFDSIPTRHAELCAELPEDHVNVKLTIQLTQLNLCLREFYDDLRQLS